MQRRVDQITEELPLPAVARMAMEYFVKADASGRSDHARLAVLQRAASGLGGRERLAYREMVNIVNAVYLGATEARLRVGIILAQSGGLAMTIGALQRARSLCRIVARREADAAAGKTLAAELDQQWEQAMAKLEALRGRDPIGSYRALVAKLETALAAMGCAASDVPKILLEPIELAAAARADVIEALAVAVEEAGDLAAETSAS